MEGVEPNGTKVSARGTVERMSMDVPIYRMTYVPFPESLDFSWGIMARVFAKLVNFPGIWNREIDLRFTRLHLSS